VHIVELPGLTAAALRCLSTEGVAETG